MKRRSRVLALGLTAATMLAAVTIVLWLAAPVPVQAQAGRNAAPPAAKAAAPIDLTGYWAAVVTEDWRLRMLGAPKGDFGVGPPGAIVRPGANPYGTGANPAEAGSIPYKVMGAKAALQWDPAKDEAEGDLCKAFGAAGIMRQPTNLHITWQDDNTLKLETDYGMQTRVFHFITAPQGGQMSYQSGIYSPADPPKFDAPAGTGPSLQGYSAALWTSMGSDREGYERSGSLKVVTSRLLAGYYWRNGMPYTGNAVVTEHYRILDLPDQSRWIILVLIVEDPEYLTQPFIVNYHFKKLPDGSTWHPAPCSVR